MAEAGNIKVIFSAVTAQFDKAVSNIQKNLTSLEDKFQKIGAIGKTLTKTVTLPFLALGGAAFAAAAKLGYTADRILDLTEITGLSAKSIQEWQHVARVAGVEIEAVTDAIEGLVRRLPQLESEGGRSAEQLAKLGLSFKDIKTKAPEELINTIIQRLAEMEDTLERNAVGAALFGRAWEDIAPILGLGEKGIEEARREAEKLGLVLSDEALKSAVEFRIELDKLKAQLEMTFLAFGQAALPVLQSLLNVIRSILPAIQGLINAFASLPDWLQSSIAGIAAFAAALGPIMMGISAVVKAFTKLKPLLVTFQKIIPSLIAGFKTLATVLSGLSLATTGLIGIIGALTIGFIHSAIQAKKFKEEIGRLKEIMETATTDSERFFAAFRLYSLTFDEKQLEIASNIAKKYGLTVEDIDAKAKELGVTFEEAGAILIQQAEAEKEATEQAEALEDALKGLTVAGRKNLQTFDEVNQIQEEGAETSIIGGLDEDLNNMKKVAKDTADKLTKLGTAIEDVGDASKDASGELKHLDGSTRDASDSAEDMESVLSRKVYPILRDLDAKSFALSNTLKGLSLMEEDVGSKASTITPELQAVYDILKDLDQKSDDVMNQFYNFSGSLDSLPKPLKNAESSLSNINTTLSDTKTGFELLSITGSAAVTTLETKIKTPLDNIEGFLRDIEYKTGDVSDAFWDTEGEVDDATWDIEGHTDEMKDNVIGDFKTTYDEVIGHSIVSDLVEDVIEAFKGLKTKLVPTTDDIQNIIENAFKIDEGKVKTEADKIPNAFNDIPPKIKPPLEETKKKIEEAFDIEDVIRDFERLGGAIAGAIWESVENQDDAGEAMERIWGAIAGTAKNIFVTVFGGILQQGIQKFGEWALGVLANVGSVVAGWLSEAYAALVAFFAWMGPGAPFAAAAVITGALAGITAFAVWAANQITSAIGLATGGIVTEPTLAVIGEGGKKEAVIPLERDNVIANSVGDAVYSAMITAMRVQSAMTSPQTASGEQTITLEIDGNTFARLILPKIQSEADRQGLQLLMQEGM